MLVRQEAQNGQGGRPNLEPDPTTLCVHHIIQDGKGQGQLYIYSR